MLSSVKQMWKWINQHVMSVGQRKKLSLCRESNMVSVFFKKSLNNVGFKFSFTHHLRIESCKGQSTLTSSLRRCPSCPLLLQTRNALPLGPSFLEASNSCPTYLTNALYMKVNISVFFFLPLCLFGLAVRYFRWIKSTRQPSHMRLRKIRIHYSRNVLIDFLPYCVINRSQIRKFKFLKRTQATASLQPVPHFQQIQQKGCADKKSF